MHERLTGVPRSPDTDSPAVVGARCSTQPRGGASRRRALLGLGLLLASLSLAPAADARWGREHCSEVSHCYGISGRNIERFGGVLASIDFVDTTPTNFNGIAAPDAPEGFIDEEQWISWPSKGSEWIETGQANGAPYGCCEEHPFYAEEQRGKYNEYISPGTVPTGSYNHYVLFDASRNGLWHIYWGCCEVGAYGGGWPAYLMAQEAGIEAATPSQPYNWGRQEVAASNGGQWSPWYGAGWYHDPGICIASNIDDGAEGDVMWSTQPGC